MNTCSSLLACTIAVYSFTRNQRKEKKPIKAKTCCNWRPDELVPPQQIKKNWKIAFENYRKLFFLSFIEFPLSYILFLFSKFSHQTQTIAAKSPRNKPSSFHFSQRKQTNRCNTKPLTTLSIQRRCFTRTLLRSPPRRGGRLTTNRVSGLATMTSSLNELC